ncbi:unnamed protein product [Calypogeia fissa]
MVAIRVQQFNVPTNASLQLEYGIFTNCSTQMVVYTNLADGNRVFTVVMNTARGQVGQSPGSVQFGQIVCTKYDPPTAVLDAGPPFTKAMNITVNVKFSEPCIRLGFQCPNTSRCDAYVNGP